MKKILPDVLEKGRVTNPYGFVGEIFFIVGPCDENLALMSISDGDWEHVCVSVEGRVPNWHEMCFVKDLFWEPEECVIQFHPPHSQYINNYETCLHLWRHKNGHALPPRELVVAAMAEKVKEKIHD